MKETDNNLILNKIKEYKEFRTDAELADFLGVTRQNLSAWRSRNSLNVNILVDRLPELSRVWLLTGEGEMLSTTDSSEAATKPSDPLSRSLATLIDTNATLVTTNAQLVAQLADLLQRIKGDKQ